jgi:RNA polymerase sigma factor (TIGR02999 family)
MNEEARVTELLHGFCSGEPHSEEKLFEIAYEELLVIARAACRGQVSGATLQPTAIVSEAYLRLARHAGDGWVDRKHFYAVAAQAMRQLIADHARRRGAAKRGGQWNKVTLDAALQSAVGEEVDLVALDEALSLLDELDERRARIVKLKFFAGLTNEEVAEVLGVSSATVKTGWRAARAWLRMQLAGEEAP